MPDTHSTDQVLLLTDGRGSYYAIPRPVLEHHRVAGDLVHAIKDALRDEVSGYAWISPEFAGSDRIEMPQVGPVAHSSNAPRQDPPSTGAVGAERLFDPALLGVELPPFYFGCFTSALEPETGFIHHA